MLNKISTYFITFALFFRLATLNAYEHRAVIKKEFVHFTVPFFDSYHASTLTETQSGTILCAYFAGTQEGAKDVAIWMSIYEEDKWSAPQKVAQGPDVPCWNPVLFTMPSNEVLLFYKIGPSPTQWSGQLKRSFDEGKSWSEEIDLPAGILGPIKNKPLLVEDHTLLCGSSVESWQRWGCWIDTTSDEGRTWQKSTPINVENQLFGIIQPTLIFSNEGSIRLLTRSHQIGSICTAQSFDQGKTWTAAIPTNLPNPNSGIDAVNLSDGRAILVYNHTESHRHPLNVAISDDGGETWQERIDLETLPGEYSYPSVIQTRDGMIHITYTWNRTAIRHIILDPEFL